MDHKEQLAEIRREIDGLDEQMLQLFCRRMQLSDTVAEIKSKGNFALVDEARENAVVAAAMEKADAATKGEAAVFMRSLMGLSKSRQRKHLYGSARTVETLLPSPRKPAEGDVRVAFQGVPGAWAEIASLKLFPQAEITAQENWEDVFIAVKDKKAHYGVVPVENSQSGAIGEVYDLLRKYGCYIVGQTWVPVRHCLMAAPGARLEDIREVFSHPEGFKQCAKFLRGRGWDLTGCRNTAVAARKVAEKKENRYAAIGSERAAQLNGLVVLSDDIISDETNKTRFIVIADAPEYDETADTVSVIFRTAHRSGALVDVLFPLLSENVNVTRLESRPIADGKYCFFTDIEGNMKDERISAALLQAASCCGFLEVLGCYRH
ncbi:MAG: prephenate dehydratase domain-containing protein [Oscillospiraceae bacterium]|nr:prephenate dehydratase domain-containing protein [Oscillospiraceae bacterium]